MKVIVVKDYDAMSAKALEIMKAVVVEKPNAVWGLLREARRSGCMRI